MCGGFGFWGFGASGLGCIWGLGASGLGCGGVGGYRGFRLRVWGFGLKDLGRRLFSKLSKVALWPGASNMLNNLKPTI